MARQENEAQAVRIDNAATATSKAAPSSATDGIAVVRSRRQRARAHLHIEKSASGGDRDVTISVYGYVSVKFSQDVNEKLSEIASSGFWSLLYTKEITSTVDFNQSYLLEGIQDFDRVATAFSTNSGTSPVLTTSIGFGGEQGIR